jgi:hypothetical protein
VVWSDSMSREERLAHYAELERLLNDVLKQLHKQLPPRTRADALAYIDHAEYGLAWEVLWDLVHKDRLPVPVDLAKCGQLMDFDLSVPSWLADPGR